MREISVHKGLIYSLATTELFASLPLEEQGRGINTQH